MYKKTILDNGLRIVTNNLPNTQAVTVLIIVGAGSRYETKDINGLSHFLEHMFFKGASRYKNTKEVSEAIDSVGGDFNAFTGKEYVGYYVKVAGKHVDTALDVLSDMMVNAKFDPEEIERERGVILEEYNMYQDTPMHQIGWDFEKLLYGDQPMGWDQVGTKEIIKSLKQENFFNYKKTLYTPDNTVIAIAGNANHEDMVEKIKKYFAGLQDGKKAFDAKVIEHNQEKRRIYLRNKKTEQAHLMIGFPGYPERHQNHYALKLLSIVLGGNMSSRMFLSVRERQGLAYYISCSTDDYTDCGSIAVNAGVALEGIDKAITAILEQYKDVRENEISAEELNKAKEFLKGKMVLRLEDSEEYAHLLGKYDVLYGEARTPEHIMAEIDKVTTAEILRVAKELFLKEKLFLAVIGPYENEEKFAALMNL
jgi:predicted Zn-dependent peptidase